MPRNIDRIDDRVLEVSPETTVWRYLRLERFLPLLTNQMYFPRPTQFDDRWEGMFPPSYLRRIRTRNAGSPDLEIETDHLLARRNMHRNAHFVSCWHISEHESDAMWRLYALAPEGLAIKSTVGDLLECFRPDGHGAVQYYDPSADQRTNNIFLGLNDILWKRQDFAWEKEYRIWFDDAEMIGAFSEVGDVQFAQPMEGQLFDFSEAQRLIKQIVVAPFATKEYVEILTAVLSQNNRRWMIPLIQRSKSEQSWEEFADEAT
ncbi:MAG: hypothetical protein H7Z17_01285 [Fuerstia sp.]|nr:hypothetical protein [Fuerstiella sp.]